MYKRSRMSLVALLIALGISSVAVAQSAPPATQDGQASAASASKGSQSPLKPGDRNCLQTTGSLIPAKPGTCLPVNGRSYSNRDIKNTGQPNIGPALQQLDPSITVRGGH